MKLKEIWKNITGFEDLYQVSNFGRVRRKKGYQAKKDRILKPIDNGNGYLGVALSKNSIYKRYYIHRLVAKTFIGDSNKEVNHKDGDKSNNKLSNLEWLSRSENQKHRYKVLKHKGANTGKTGSKNARSKPVIQLGLNGYPIKRFESVMQAFRVTGVCESNIRGVIYGRQNMAGGYKWKYE